jgi:hypothetical protein
MEIYEFDEKRKEIVGQKIKYCNSAPEPRLTSTNAVVIK